MDILHASLKVGIESRVVVSETPYSWFPLPIKGSRFFSIFLVIDFFPICYQNIVYQWQFLQLQGRMYPIEIEDL